MAILGTLIEQVRGVSYKPEDLHTTLNENSVTLLRANNIKDGKLNFDDVVYVDKRKVSEKQLLKSGDILICASSGSKELVGKAAYVAEDMAITFGAFCKVVRPKTECPQYIGHFFNSPYYRERIANAAAGANINNIRNEHIDVLEIAWPSHEEQQDAVAVLDKVIELIAQRKEQLAKLDQLVKFRFIELFGDPVKNNMGWESKPLNDVCDGIGDGLHGTPEYDEGGEYPFINGNNLIDGEIIITPATKMVAAKTYEKHFIDISTNAILISINGTLGKLAFYNGEKVMLGKSACYCNLKQDINKVFVYGVMKSDAFAEFLENSSTKSTIKNVGLKAMREFRLILPPMELQEQFATFVEQTDKSKLAIQQSLDKLELLKKSLMQEYFG